MSKYIDAEKLVAEIERRKKSIDECPFIEAELGASIKRDAKIETFNELISLITSLQQEQPEVDLEKEIERQIRSIFYDLDGIAIMGTSKYASVEDMEYIARHFYELGQSEMRERIANPEYNKMVLEKMKFEYPLDENNARKEE